MLSQILFDTSSSIITGVVLTLPVLSASWTLTRFSFWQHHELTWLCITSLCASIQRWNISPQMHWGPGIWPQMFGFCFVLWWMFLEQPTHSNWRGGTSLELVAHMARETPEPGALWTTYVWGPADASHIIPCVPVPTMQCSPGDYHLSGVSKTSILTQDLTPYSFTTWSLLSPDVRHCLSVYPSGGLKKCHTSSSALVCICEKEICLFGQLSSSCLIIPSPSFLRMSTRVPFPFSHIFYLL